MKQKKVHSSPLYQIGLSKNHFTVVLGSNKMCLLVKGGCMSPLGKYCWISQPLQNPKIPSGSFVERRKLGLEQTFVNFQSCQRCKKKLAFPVAWSQQPLYLLFPIFSLTEGVRGASILTECRTWQPNPIEMPSTQRSAKTKGENDDLLTFVNWLRYPLWRVEQVKKAWRSEAEPPNILKSHFFQITYVVSWKDVIFTSSARISKPRDFNISRSGRLNCPFFQIYWLKDRVEVQPERDSNYIQAADGHLIIIQAREKDRANYTCVAENVANRRLSPPARLNIHGKSNLLTQFFFTPRLANSIK